MRTTAPSTIPAKKQFVSEAVRKTAVHFQGPKERRKPRTRTIRKLLTGTPIHIDDPALDSLPILCPSWGQGAHSCPSNVQRDRPAQQRPRLRRKLYSGDENAVSRRSSTHALCRYIRFQAGRADAAKGELPNEDQTARPEKATKKKRDSR